MEIDYKNIIKEIAEMNSAGKDNFKSSIPQWEFPIGSEIDVMFEKLKQYLLDFERNEIGYKL